MHKNLSVEDATGPSKDPATTPAIDPDQRRACRHET